ncbi:MAG: hypothetical protein AAFR35_04715 [Pseudomonadota bacterium]
MTVAIARTREADIAPGQTGAWRETCLARTLPHMPAVDGFHGNRVMVSQDRHPCRMTMLATWQSMDAIRRYSGETPEFMAPFFPDYDAAATFHDEVLVEAKT